MNATDDDKHSKKARCLVHPNSKIKIYFDILIMIFSIWNSILIPLEIGYE